MVNVCFFILILLYFSQHCLSKLATPSPLPLLPIPSAAQLKWQRREIIMSFHFGMNTFTNSESGTGNESPSLFNPTALNVSQWVSTASDLGISLVILNAKHHDGFCLWPSAYTDHSVKSSPWLGGQGDIVREFTDAAKSQGVDVGLSLSPWDRHEKTYENEIEYNEFYLDQLRELLTRYGSVSEISFDGAKGANAANMNYYFQDWFSVTKELQGSINIFSDAGPDVRWVGDESGFAGATSWSTINRTMLKIGEAGNEKYLNTGDPEGTDWVPPECVVSIRPGWFWHESEDPKPLRHLLDIYYHSVGRNCVLLLNVPPNTTGLISENDVAVLHQFRATIDTIFSSDLALQGTATASSERGGSGGGFGAENVLDGDEGTYWAPSEGGTRHWIEVTVMVEKFNVVRIQEAIELGQRIMRHEVYVHGFKVASGTTVGHKKLYILKPPVMASKVTVVILESRGLPLISAIGLHMDSISASGLQMDSYVGMESSKESDSKLM